MAATATTAATTTTKVIQETCFKCMDAITKLDRPLMDGELNKVIDSIAPSYIQSLPDIGFVLCLVAGLSLAELKAFMKKEYNLTNVEPLFEKYMSIPEFAGVIKTFIFANTFRGGSSSSSRDNGLYHQDEKRCCRGCVKFDGTHSRKNVSFLRRRPSHPSF